MFSNLQAETELRFWLSNRTYVFLIAMSDVCDAGVLLPDTSYAKLSLWKAFGPTPSSPTPTALVLFMNNLPTWRIEM